MKKSRDFGWTFVSYPMCVEGTDGTVVISILGGTHWYAVCSMSVECKIQKSRYLPPRALACRVACREVQPESRTRHTETDLRLDSDLHFQYIGPYLTHVATRGNGFKTVYK